MPEQIETRTFELDQLELRQVDGQPPVVVGYAVVFDTWSEIMTNTRGRQFRERIAPGAFDRVLSGNPDIRALWNHNADKPLGRTRNGTLRLEKDGLGIRIELAPPATTWGADAVESIRRGDVSGMSFAFAPYGVNGSTWARGVDGVAEHVVLDADLFDVSPVTFPAYPATMVGIRSIEVPDVESDSQVADEIQAPVVDAQARMARMRRELDLAEVENK